MMPSSHTALSGTDQHDWIAQWALLAIGVSSTIYVTLGNLAGMPIRTVQLVPLGIGLVGITLLEVPQRSVGKALLGAPCLWGGYTLVRFFFSEAADPLVLSRPVVCVFVYLATIGLLQHVRSPGYLFGGLAIGCLISLAISFLGISIGDIRPVEHTGRWSGLMPDANRLGNLCGDIVIVGLASILTWQAARRNWLVCLGVAIGAIGLMASGSRGALLAVICAVGVLIASLNRAKRRVAVSPRSILTAGILIAICVALITCFRSHVPERLVAFIDKPSSAIEGIVSDSRVTLFGIAFGMFLEEPIIGIGPEGAFFEAVSQDGTVHQSNGHSTYLCLLATSGIIGLVLYLVLPLMLLQRSLQIVGPRSCYSKEMRLSAATALGLLACSCAHNFVMNMAESVHVWLVFAAIVCLCTTPAESRPIGPSDGQVAPSWHVNANRRRSSHVGYGNVSVRPG